MTAMATKVAPNPLQLYLNPNDLVPTSHTPTTHNPQPLTVSTQIHSPVHDPRPQSTLARAENGENTNTEGEEDADADADVEMSDVGVDPKRQTADPSMFRDIDMASTTTGLHRAHSFQTPSEPLLNPF